MGKTIEPKKSSDKPYYEMISYENHFLFFFVKMKSNIVFKIHYILTNKEELFVVCGTFFDPSVKGHRINNKFDYIQKYPLVPTGILAPSATLRLALYQQDFISLPYLFQKSRLIATKCKGT